jgi:dienelactone hydrolase
MRAGHGDGQTGAGSAARLPTAFKWILVAGSCLAAASLAGYFAASPILPPKPSGPYISRLTAMPSDQPMLQRAAGSHPPPRLQTWYPIDPRDNALPPGQFPVILYFSGWPGSGIDNRTVIGELVSHGYVVVALTYPTADTPMDFSSAEALERTTALFERWVTMRGVDAAMVLDLLERLRTAPSAPPFAWRLDLGHVGIFGFSLGGAVASHACFIEPRVEAVVNIDATHWIDVPSGDASCHQLFISEELPPPAPADLNSPDALTRSNARMDRRDYDRIDATLARFGGTHVIVPHTRHLDFTDRVLQSPFRRRVQRLIDARRLVAMMNAFILSFFDDTLRSDGSRRFDAATAPYTDVQVRSFKPLTSAAQ